MNKKFVLYFDLADPSARQCDWPYILVSPKIQVLECKGDLWVVEAEDAVIAALLVLFPDMRAKELKTYQTV